MRRHGSRFEDTIDIIQRLLYAALQFKMHSLTGKTTTIMRARAARETAWKTARNYFLIELDIVA